MKTWFSVGLYASLILLPISIFLLLFSIYQNFSRTSQLDRQLVIEPLVPGVNLPVSELWYYSATLVICTVVHEMGHALAAVQNDVNLNEVGLRILFVLPIAYVNLSTEKFKSLEKKTTLKILCAGIWHNLVLSFGAYLIYFCLPTIFSLFFHVNQGVTITEIAKRSPLLGQRGLDVGDIIYSINECKVKDERSWYNCLSEIEKQKVAFCITHGILDVYDETVPLTHSDNGQIDCCDPKKSGNLCFGYLDVAGGVLEMPSHACLPGRIVVESSEHFCSDSPHSCPTGTYCFHPIIANGSDLFKISCKSKHVIYVGTPNDIFRTIEVSSYIPSSFFISTAIPDAVTKFCTYVAIISLGLAIINIIPFMYMDGQHITEVLGYILIKKRFGKNMTKLITVLITWCFTFLLFFHCMYTIYGIVV